MEFLKENIRKSESLGRAFSQLAIDDDFIIPDTKVDAVRIIHTVGELFLEETSVNNQSVWMKGKLAFSVLYRSDRSDKKLEVLVGSLPFQEKLNMDGVEDMTPLQMGGRLEDLSINLINSRKLGIRAVLEIEAVAKSSVEEEIVTGLCENKQYEQKLRTQELLDLIGTKKDVLRVKEEVALPSVKPDIHKILWKCVQPINLESTVMESALRITGELRVGILYSSQSVGELQWFENTVAVRGEIPWEGCHREDLIWVNYGNITCDLEPRNDYDGEAKILGVECAIELELKAWREKQISMLMDVFALDKELKLQTESRVYQKLRMTNHAKLRISEQVLLEKGQENIMQLCMSQGRIQVDDMCMTGDGVQVEGLLVVDLLYVTGNDNYPIDHHRAAFPFSQLIEISGANENTEFELNTTMEQLNVNLLDNSEYEVKAVVGLHVMAVDHIQCQAILSATECEPDLESLAKQPGIIGYVVREEEELWDIAKRYHTTVAELMETNGLQGENVEAGKKLLIVKQVG